MKKHIISILLSLVIILTMTACVSNDTQLATSKLETIPTVEATVVKTVTTEETEADLKVKTLKLDVIEAMTPEDVSTFFDEMIQLTENETLSYQNMYDIGLNFHDIWWYNNEACNQEELNEKSYEAFINIYNQAIEQHITLDKIYSWTFTPLPNVLYMYFSSDNFSSTDDIACASFYKLEEDDAIHVAEAIFGNPLFSTNAFLPFDVLSYPCDEIEEMGWKHLIALSNTTSPLVDENTYWICMQIFFQTAMYDNEAKFIEISKNIMENPNYDFVDKYFFFCNDIPNEKISKMAYEKLYELARNADEETSLLIQQVASEMYNHDVAHKLLDLLGVTN